MYAFIYLETTNNKQKATKNIFLSVCLVRFKSIRSLLTIST